jgi:hypothetical protein
MLTVDYSSGSQTMLHGAQGLRDGFPGNPGILFLMTNFNCTEFLHKLGLCR